MRRIFRSFGRFLKESGAQVTGQGKRFEKSVRNGAAAFGGQFINLFFGFAVRTVFIRLLGKEYLGVNGVMESMLMLLSMTELGVGTSVAFALYEPVNNGDERKIGRLMAFYRRTYHALGFLTLVAGLALVPFMRFFTREAEQVPHMNVIYLLFLAGTVLSYFFAYKRTLLSAYQDNHINTLCEDGFTLLKYLLQTVVLVVFRSYIGFLAIHLVCIVAANAVISVLCDRKYGFIKAYRAEKLEPGERALLQKSVVSLMYQKICAKLVTGTDNLMISYAGIALMGVYSNYAMVISTITRITYNVSQALLGSVGNLMVQKDDGHKYRVFEELVFTEFCFYFFASAGLSAVLERFIGLWAGEGWLLAPLVTFAVILNFFLTGMRQPNILVIEAAGLFNRLRAKAVLEVVVNFVVSLVFLLGLRLGIYGVLFGTTVSMVSVCIWWESLAVHKYAFHTGVGRYAAAYAGYVLVAAVGCFASYFAAKSIPVGGVGGLLLAGLAAVVIAGLLLCLVYGRSRLMKAVLNRIKFRKKESLPR